MKFDVDQVIWVKPDVYIHRILSQRATAPAAPAARAATSASASATAAATTRAGGSGGTTAAPATSSATAAAGRQGDSGRTPGRPRVLGKEEQRQLELDRRIALSEVRDYWGHP